MNYCIRVGRADAFSSCTHSLLRLDSFSTQIADIACCDSLPLSSKNSSPRDKVSLVTLRERHSVRVLSLSFSKLFLQKSDFEFCSYSCNSNFEFCSYSCNISSNIRYMHHNFFLFERKKFKILT